GVIMPRRHFLTLDIPCHCHITGHLRNLHWLPVNMHLQTPPPRSQSTAQHQTRIPQQMAHPCNRLTHPQNYKWRQIILAPRRQDVEQSSHSPASDQRPPYPSGDFSRPGCSSS
ncbi:hypothetical protein NDU88_007291, partial [Pleurodeles waltl]